MATLDSIRVGQRCRIESLGGPPALVQRLLEFGLMDGEELTIIALAPLGDPIEVQGPLTRLSLRKAEAAHIQVRPLS